MFTETDFQWRGPSQGHSVKLSPEGVRLATHGVVTAAFTCVAGFLWVCRVAHLGMGWATELSDACEVVESHLGLVHLLLLVSVSAAELLSIREQIIAMRELAHFCRGNCFDVALQITVTLLKLLVLSVAWLARAHHGCAAIPVLSGETMLVLLGVVTVADSFELALALRRRRRRSVATDTRIDRPAA